MKIEFVIPTYNRPHQLMSMICSIFSQTSPNWKIHVVADAFYDGYQKVKDYFENDERIKFTELNSAILPLLVFIDSSSSKILFAE